MSVCISVSELKVGFDQATIVKWCGGGGGGFEKEEGCGEEGVRRRRV